MSDKESLYDLVKKVTALEILYEQKKQLRRNESRTILFNMMKDICQTLESIATVPLDCFDDKVLEEKAAEPQLKIQRENAHYLRSIKNKMLQLMLEINKTIASKIPDDLEKRVDDLDTEIRESKRQLKAATSLAENLDCIIKQEAVIEADTSDTTASVNSTKNDIPYII